MKTFRTPVKKILDCLLHGAGLNIERYFGDDLALKELVTISDKEGIDLLLDVGANTGQFALKMLNVGFNKPIISFEPLKEVHNILLKNAALINEWGVYERCAIGDFDGEIEINVSANSYSSSILNISPVHIESAPSAAFIGKEKVTIKKLDTIANEFKGENILLKIDTQGFEDKVLKGSKDLLKSRIRLIQLELSLLPLYENAMLIDDMISFLGEIGFKPLFYSPGYVNRLNGNIQQLDGYFLKI